MIVRPTALALLLATHATFSAGVEDRGSVFRLHDGRLSAEISKRDGKLVSLKWGDDELIRGGQGYWSLSARSDRGRVTGFPPVASAAITADPARGGNLAEVTFTCPAVDRPGTLPVNATFRYAMVEGGAGLHVYGTFEHPPELDGFSMGEGRYVVKLDPEIFDSIHIDPRRQRVMPSGFDWDHGSPLNVKEARRMTTGIHKGAAEHKYGYSAVYSETPAYGWYSSHRKLGLWMVHPSFESIAGGPTKPELTAHLDVNPGGLPVLLNMWHGSHYGGSSLAVRKGEAWSKTIGPFLIHINEGPTADAMAEAALATAATESRSWPYPWVRDAEYAADSRHKVSGRIVLKDPDALPDGTMWVGLTAPDHPSRDRRGAETIGWQRDGKNYQYWIRATSDGRFTLPSVRPGNYVLRAFRTGVLGEFEMADITVSADADLGSFDWLPDRSGPTLWEIGVPDRSAAEFRGGDRYWNWGTYHDYRRNFPDGVDFEIGSSDWREDWNFCQPPIMDESGRVSGDSTWRVRFALAEPCDAVLRIALCGYREGGRLHLTLNGAPLGDTGRFRENGVMHRDGIRGILTVWNFPISADLLRPGDNTLELRSSASVWHQGILYDYLRLEAVAPKSSARADREDSDS